MAKNYRVTVNGSVYDVCVEETGVGAAPVQYSAPVAVPAAAPAPVAAPAPAPTAAPVPAAVSAAPGEGTPVKAPMNGSILRINVKVGDSVKKDDVICVLEAMKMENEIFSPQDGVVTSVVTSQGASVNAEDVLITLK